MELNISRRSVLQGLIASGIVIGVDGVISASKTFGEDPATALVKQAIRNANLLQLGAKFYPFTLKIANTSHFQNIWSSERGDTPMDFYRFKGNADPGFLPLGDLALTNRNSLDDFGALLIAATDSDILEHPVGFEWVLDDHKSGNSRDVKYWRAIAPDGYASLGLCFTNGDKPEPKNYWCVNKEHLSKTSNLSNYWGDSGSRWSHNGDLVKPSIPQDIPQVDEKIFIAPTTYLSREGLNNQDGEKGWVLVASQCSLPVTPLPLPDPTYDPDTKESFATQEGVMQIAVLPYTAVADQGYDNQAKKSPFYYIVNQRGWNCIGSYPSPEGSTHTISFEIGTSESTSKSFSESTSITVGANVGVQVGGFGASVSVSYTRTFNYEHSETKGSSTQSTTATQIPFPKADKVWLWQSFADLRVFRSNQTLVANIIYKLPEYRLTYQEQ